MAAAGCVLSGVSLLVSVALYTRINDERERNVRATCEETNVRHDATIRQLDMLLAVRLRNASGEERRRIEQSRASTVLLIDALMPVRDCDQRVREQVSS